MAVTFLHIADLHLDSPFKSISKISKTLSNQMKRASKDSFEQLMSIAIENNVDMIIIAGDSFNSDKPNVSTQLFFKQQLQRAINANIQVVLCFGNHDYVHQELLVTLPKEVIIFSKDVSTYYLTAKSGERVAVSGFSYHTNHINKRMIAQFPAKQSSDFHIGVYHGEVLGDTVSGGLYAPFSLQELNEKHYDYWALGHIHKRQLLQKNPPIAYSGSIQGLNRKEVDEKGGYLVTLQSKQFAAVSPVNTAPIIWLEKHMTITVQTTIEQIVSKWQLFCESLLCDKMYLFSIVWDIEQNVSKEIIDTLMSDDFKGVLTKENKYIIKRMLNKVNGVDTVSLNAQMQSIWIDLQNNGLNNELYDDVMQHVFQHRYMTLLLPELKHDKLLKEEIMQKAITRIQQQLEENSHEN